MWGRGWVEGAGGRLQIVGELLEPCAQRGFVFFAEQVLAYQGFGVQVFQADIGAQFAVELPGGVGGTLSANLGNVLSVLAAGVFLPMLPLQLLAQNLCYDLAQLALPLDRVDPDQLRKPQRWSTRDLLGFIACFAPLSSLFDLATFWLLGHLLSVDGTSGQALFHTCWFIENLLTQILAVQVIRTARVPLRHSRTTAPVALAAFAACGIAILLPYTPAAPRLGFQAPPLVLLAILAITATGYLAALQHVKVAYPRLTGRSL
ncbi:MAG: magnesium-transporting ATPase [Dactylosporangium sp.]|nr:magnesium-transporting ATPase [Dactylosporangium sp.]